MHEMLQHLSLVFCRCLLFYWHAHETVYYELPQVVQLGTEGATLRLTEHMVVGKSVAWGSTNAIARGTRAQGLFPEARSDASLWGCSWGSRKRVATGLLLPGALTTTMGQLCGGHVIPEAHKQLGLAYSLQQ